MHEAMMNQTRREMFQALCALPVAASAAALPEAAPCSRVAAGSGAAEGVSDAEYRCTLVAIDGVWQFSVRDDRWICISAPILVTH